MSLKHFLTLWSPRILGIAVSFVLSLFALDAVSYTHLTLPTIYSV